MAALSGKAGRFDYAGHVVNINAWTMDLDTNLIETSAWSTGTDQWRSYTAGLNGASFTALGFFDAASTGQDDMRGNILTPATALVALEIDKSGGAKFSGSALLERLGLDVDIDGSADVSYDGRFTGTVSYTTTT